MNTVGPRPAAMSLSTVDCDHVTTRPPESDAVMKLEAPMSSNEITSRPGPSSNDRDNGYRTSEKFDGSDCLPMTSNSLSVHLNDEASRSRMLPVSCRNGSRSNLMRTRDSSMGSSVPLTKGPFPCNSVEPETDAVTYVIVDSPASLKRSRVPA